MFLLRRIKWQQIGVNLLIYICPSRGGTSHTKLHGYKHFWLMIWKGHMCKRINGFIQKISIIFRVRAMVGVVVITSHELPKLNQQLIEIAHGHKTPTKAGNRCTALTCMFHLHYIIKMQIVFQLTLGRFGWFCNLLPFVRNDFLICIS